MPVGQTIKDFCDSCWPLEAQAWMDGQTMSMRHQKKQVHLWLIGTVSHVSVDL